jgi:hypothetical protein
MTYFPRGKRTEARSRHRTLRLDATQVTETGMDLDWTWTWGRETRHGNSCQDWEGMVGRRPSGSGWETTCASTFTMKDILAMKDKDREQKKDRGMLTSFQTSLTEMHTENGAPHRRSPYPSRSRCAGRHSASLALVLLSPQPSREISGGRTAGERADPSSRHTTARSSVDTPPRMLTSMAGRRWRNDGVRATNIFTRGRERGWHVTLVRPWLAPRLSSWLEKLAGYEASSEGPSQCPLPHVVTRRDAMPTRLLPHLLHHATRMPRAWTRAHRAAVAPLVVPMPTPEARTRLAAVDSKSPS